MKDQHRNALWVVFVFCLVFAGTVTATGRAVVAQQRTSAPAAPRRYVGTSGDEQVVVHSDLITLNISVTGAEGRAIPGLGKDVFTVYDDKVPQEVTFFSDEDAPASVAVIFDTSGSMSEGRIERAREALARFIQTSHEKDEFFLIDFNTSAHLLLDRTRDAGAVLDKFTYVRPRGNTALYDAAYLGIEKVLRGAHIRRAILLISDGEDNNSRYTFKELRRRLQESGVVVYSIGIGVSYLPRATGAETLKKLASVSGGKAFFPDGAAEMSEVFERIALELRHQYSVGFRPSNFAADGRWHRLKVKVQPPSGTPRLFVRSREGYYAGANGR